MTIVVDPVGREIRALARVMDWRGKDVLEAGCGEGRLTLRLATLGAAQVVAFDPDRTLIRTARRNLPPQLKPRIHYQVGQAERVRRRAGRFDVVVFSWAL